MNIQETFAANMRRLRKAAHMTQEELAEKSGLHRTYIGGIEQQRVNVSLKNIGKIANALDSSPALLFLGDGEESPEPQRTPNDENGERPKSKQSVLNVGEFALCEQTEKGLAISPIEVECADLTIQILCALINEGYEGSLQTAYEKAQREIMAFYNSSRQSSKAKASSE